MIILSESIQFKPVETVRINESVSISGEKPVKSLMKVRGIFQRYDVTNSNGRGYSEELFDKVLGESSIVEAFKNRSMLGLVEHPKDGLTRLDRSPSHVVLGAWNNHDGSIMGEALILNTAAGRDLAAIFEAGCSVGISSRGEGDLISENGRDIVDPNTYRLITWDFVYDNSVPGARVVPVNEGANPNGTATSNVNKYATSTPLGSGYSFGSGIITTGTDTSIHRPTSGLGGIHESNKSGEYINVDTRNSTMKLNEMRRLSLELTKTIPSGGCKGMSFTDRVALSEMLVELKGKVNTLLHEDASLSGMGQKLIKRITEAEDDIEDLEVDPVKEPPVEESPVEEEPPVEESPVEEEPPVDEPKSEEGICDIDIDTFKTVLNAMVAEFFPEAVENCDELDVTSVYDEFCETGQLDGLKEQLNSCEGNSEESEEKYESSKRLVKKLVAECNSLKARIKRLKGLDESDGGNSTELHSQVVQLKAKLRESVSLLESSKDQLKKAEEGRRLLIEARDYITQLKKSKNIELKESRESNPFSLKNFRNPECVERRKQILESIRAKKGSTSRTLNESTDLNECHDTLRIIMNQRNKNR